MNAVIQRSCSFGSHLCRWKTTLKKRRHRREILALQEVYHESRCDFILGMSCSQQREWNVECLFRAQLFNLHEQDWLRWLNSHRRVDSLDLRNCPNCKFSAESENTITCKVKRRSIFQDTWARVPFPLVMGLRNLAQARCKEVSPSNRKNTSNSSRTNWTVLRDTAASMMFLCC